MSISNNESTVSQTLVKEIKGGNVTFESINQIAKQTIIKGEISFEEVSVEKFNLEHFESPPFAKEIVDRIELQKVIVLSGDSRINKYDLAKHIAYLIKLNHPDMCVKEFMRTSYAGLNIRRELHNAKKGTIFILPDATQDSFRMPFAEIKKLFSSSGNCVIGTTDTLQEVWRSGGTDCLYEISFQDVEGFPHLVSDLSDKERMSSWYYKELDFREQLLAISLVLFNGFYGDQFFAALEQLVERVWQRRDSSLRALDYCDLDKLRNFFSFAGNNEAEETIKITSSRQRLLLLKVAWTSHRRQILSALPILVSLANDSVNKRSLELYDTEERRARLRQVIAKTLSDIALLSQDWKVVEENLLWLASSEHIKVQAVAAEALALWRSDTDKAAILKKGNTEEYNPDTKLFEVMQRWQEKAQITSLVESFLENRDHEKSTKPADYIRSTIALMVGFASEADEDDQMPEHLIERIQRLVADRNILVQKRVLSDTLPRVVRKHTKQIASYLKDFLKNADSWDFVVAISKSLAEAYTSRPDSVMEILRSWQTEAENNRPTKISKRKITLREVMLSTVALAYGEVEPNDKVDSLSSERIFKKLQKILSEELHPKVRKWTIFAVGRLVQKDFSTLEQPLQSLIATLDKEEREDVANMLTEIYLQQRHQLSGGDESFEITDTSDGETIKINLWLNSQRPLTDAETAMYRWAKDNENGAAQQVAITALASFARRFDLDESRWIEEKKKSLNLMPPDIADEYASPIQAGDPSKGWYLGKMIPWMVARNAQYYRVCIRNLLPAALSQWKNNRKSINFVLSKWLKSLDDEIKCISNKLRPGIWLAEYLKYGMVLAVVLVAVGVSAVVKQIGTSEKLASHEPLKQAKTGPIADNGIIVNENIKATDIDSSTFDQGSLTVRFSSNGTLGDVLSIRNQGRGNQKVSLDGKDVYYGDNVIGTFSGGKFSEGKQLEPLVVQFNSKSNLAAVLALMRMVIYYNVASSPELGLRTVEFQLTDDAGVASNVVTQNVLVSTENEDPKVTVPDRLMAKENVPLAVNGIRFEDHDSTENITITLAANKGIINVNNTIHGESAKVKIASNNSGKVVLKGNAKEVDTLLYSSGTIIYKSSEDDTLSVTVNDGGMDLAGNDDVSIWPPGCRSEKTVSSQLSISVEPTNKPPTISVASRDVSVNEDESVKIGSITIEDPDTEELKAYLGVRHGALSMNSGVADTLASRGNNSNNIVIQGSNKTVAAALANPEVVTYRPETDYNGSDMLQIRVDDGGRGCRASINLDVKPVDDPPVLSIPRMIVPPKTILPKWKSQTSDVDRPTIDTPVNPAPGKQVSTCTVLPGATYVVESFQTEQPNVKIVTERKVISTEDSKIILSARNLRSTSSKPRILEFTREWNLISSRNADGSGSNYSPPIKYYQFPLFPGQKWQEKSMETSTEKGAIKEHSISGLVGNWEEVTVPAGTFRCIRVRTETEVTILATGEKVRGVEDSWYVPEVGRSIKTVSSSRDKDGKEQHQIIQLLSYSPGK